MKTKKIILFIFLFFLLFSCNDNSLNISKLEHQYIMSDENSLNISLRYSIDTEMNDKHFITLTSPDKNLKWTSDSYKAFNNNNTFVQSSLFEIPYSLEGEWDVNIKLGENSVDKSFSSATPDISQLKYPLEFSTLKLNRVNGNNYSFVLNKLDESFNNTHWDVYAVFRDDNSYHFLRRQRRATSFSINISNKISYIVFTLEKDDNISFYKIIVI